ncbi:MAG: DUF5320 family protein [Bacteroidales bacterium]
MPGLDHSGPLGKGPETGRKMGTCNIQDGQGFGMGMGRGRGNGAGRALGRRAGKGRGMGPGNGRSMSGNGMNRYGTNGSNQ